MAHWRPYHVRDSRTGERCTTSEERVDIQYNAVPNDDKRRGGWMPVYRVGRGRTRGDTYGRGHDLDRAVRAAKAMAHEEAARYRGDWCVTVRRKRSLKG